MFINYIKKYLSKSDLQEIADVIKAIEKTTIGELRLCVKYKIEWHEKKNSSRELAIKEFYKLGMEKTKHRTGVLVMILFKYKKFEIIADEGINSKVDFLAWENIATELSGHFSKDNFKDGIINLLNSIGSILAREFPRNEEDIDELPNDVVIK